MRRSYNIPLDYTRVLYLQSNNNPQNTVNQGQLINTDIAPKNITLELEAATVVSACRGRRAYSCAACYDSKTSTAYHPLCYYYPPTNNTPNFTDMSNNRYYWNTVNIGDRHTYIYNAVNGGCYLDGVLNRTITDNSANISVPLGLFCRIYTSQSSPEGISLGGGLYAVCSSWRIYYVKLTDKTTNAIVSEMLPCLDKNNRPCMYDTVRQQPFYNLGTGEFSYALI